MLKLPDFVHQKLAEEFRFSADRMAETDNVATQLYFFSAFYGEINRALNYSWSKELGLIHMVLNGAHTTMSGRIEAIKAGMGGIGIASEFPGALTDLANDWAVLFEREQIEDADLYHLMARTAELAYAMTGNGFYLYAKGALRLGHAASEPEPPSARSRGGARRKASRP